MGDGIGQASGLRKPFASKASDPYRRLLIGVKAFRSIGLPQQCTDEP
jgi:hypothetical protein